MSSETQGKPPKRGEIAEKPHLGEGAAGAAPTAPHATERSKRGEESSSKKGASGPERFWKRRGLGRALAAALVVSLGVHAVVSPWNLLPKNDLEVREVEGELSIAIDTEDTPAPPEPPPPEPPPPAPTSEAEGVGSSKRDAGPKPRDAGVDAARDAESDADQRLTTELDAGIPIAHDAGGGEADGGSALEGGVAALDDAGGAGADGPRDPASTIGAAGNVQADVPLVQLLVNVAEVRKNPVGAKMGPLLSAIPEWDEFIAGTGVDPVRDTDWIYMSGPSLYSKRTSRLAIIVRYSASDAVVDRAVNIVAKKYAMGGTFDAGVPGVRAYLGHADFAQRVFLRPQSHVLAVVPPDYANTAAKILSKAKVAPKVRAGEAMRLTLKNPNHPFPFLPASLSELRVWITSRDDGGADVFGEGDAPTREEAEQAAKAIRKLVKDQNSLGVQIVTQGILNRTEVNSEGSVVRFKVPASQEQIQAIVDLVAAYLPGVVKK